MERDPQDPDVSYNTMTHGFQSSAEIEGRVHHPAQSDRSRAGYSPFDIRVYNFNNPAFGSDNNCQISSTPINPHYAYVQFELSAITGTGTPVWQPTTTWIDPNQGVDLNYQNVSKYNMKESAATESPLLDDRPEGFLARQNAYGFQKPSAAAAQLLYLPLNMICDNVLSQLISLSAYAANDWSITVRLRALNQCVAGADTTAPVGSITSMKLVLIGNRTTDEEVQYARAALAGGGIKFFYLRPSHLSFTIADNEESAANYTHSLTDINGSVAAIRILLRDKSTFDNSVEDGTNDNINWEVFNAPKDTLAIGRISEPNLIWGQALPQFLIRTLFYSHSLNNGPTYVSNTSTVDVVETSIINVNFNESPQDFLAGTSTGSVAFKNDLQIQYLMTTDTNGAVRADYDVFIHNKALVSNGSFISNLSD